jgi:hypothetical protein
MRVHTQTDRVYIDAKAEALEDKSRALVAEVRAEMHKNTSDIIKWMVGLTITSMATCISVMVFMLSNFSASMNAQFAQANTQFNVQFAQVNATLNDVRKELTAVQTDGRALPATPAPIIIQVPPYPAAPRR